MSLIPNAYSPTVPCEWQEVIKRHLPEWIRTFSSRVQISIRGVSRPSPANFSFKRKARLTTMWAVPIWIVIAGTILSGAISIRDIDWFERMSTPEVSLD